MASMEKIGRYKITGQLGSGNMGAVYEGKDPIIGRTVALKVMHFEAGFSEESAKQMRTRFLREAQAAGKLDHEHIVTVYDIGKDPASGKLYIAMEHLPGGTLRDKMKEGQAMPHDEAATHMAKLLGALDYAHDHGIVHRDIKPENILFSKTGQLRIADFGIAHFDTSNLTQTGQVLGTPYYMPPEQVNGDPIDGRADQFSAGVIFYELLTGQKPFFGKSIAEVVKKLCDHAPPSPQEVNPSVPPAMSDAVMRMLSKKTDERFATAGEAMDAVAAFLPEGATLSLKTGRSTPSQENAWVWAFPGMVFFGLVIGILFVASALGWGKPGPNYLPPPAQTSNSGNSKAVATPAPVKASKPSKATEAVRFRLEHRLSSARLTLEVDDRVVLNGTLMAEKKLGVSVKKTYYTKKLFLAQGKRRIRLHIRGTEGKVNVEASRSISVRKNETRALNAAYNSLTKKLTLDWE